MIYEADMDLNKLESHSEVFFRCVEDCSEPIMVSDAQGRLTYVNPAWIKTYGYSKEEAIGSTPRLLRSKFQDDAFYLEMWKQIRNPKIGFWRGELVNKAKAGHFVPVLLTITPYRDGSKDSDQVCGYMGIAVDLTVQKALEVRAVQQDRLASAGLVASGLAHEIGTPLGVVRGRAEFLLMEAEKNEPLKKGLEVIITQIDRVSKLIKSFLKASRPPEDIEITSVNVTNILDDVVSLAAQNARRLGIEVENKLPPNLYAQGDGNQLHQVFLNLFINATHAIEKDMERDKTKIHKITIQSRIKDERLEVSMIDTGCGMTAEVLSKIFHPFFTTKDVGKGTGLGLAISAQILAELKGSLSAKSPGPGLGATFTITLPV